MRRWIGLAAYRTVARHSSERQFTASAPRPDGELLWIHAAEAKNVLSVLDLAKRVAAARSGLKILVTATDSQDTEDAREHLSPGDPIQLEQAPSEHPDAVAAFWANWSPDMTIWTYGDLRPNLLHLVHENGCPIGLIDAAADGFDSRHDRWVPELTRQLLVPFKALLVRSNDSFRRLETLGIAATRIELTPPLRAGGHVLPCQESDLADLTQLLSGRPVWFGAGVRAQELAAVLAAHTRAVRLSHRLLLILNPATADLTQSFLEQTQAAQFRVADWSAGEDPDASIQVLLTPGSEDQGLFYRVAPVSFIGGSLVPGFHGGNPFDAAALGSAVLYGPHVRRFLPSYTRLAKAGAARIVRDADTLGAAVSLLAAPDQAAMMALAGWDVVSQGAELADRVIDLVNETLDSAAREVRRARS